MNFINKVSRDVKRHLTQSGLRSKDPLDMAEDLSKIESDLHQIILANKDTPLESE